MAIAKKDYLTKEQIETAMAQGLNTYEALGAALDRSPKVMKKIMDDFGLSFNQPSAPAQETAFEYITWDELYKKYPDTQTQFLIAECKVKRNMTAAQTADWIKQNVVRNENNFVWAAFKEAQIKTRLERIARLKTTGVLVTYPWMVETYDKARAMGIDLAEYGL